MIWLFGDTHGFFEHVIDYVRAAAAKDSAPDAIIFLGDLDCRRPLHEELAEIIDLTTVWFIPGNHDSDDYLAWNSLVSSSLSGQNLHGKVVQIGGVRIAGLGGVFRQRVWAPPAEPFFRSYEDYQQELMRKRPPKDWGHAETSEERRHKTSIFPDMYTCLAKQSADILICHEAPSCHPYGWRALDDLARSLQVKQVIHGHHHDNLDYSSFTKLQGFSAHGVGFCGITELSRTGVTVIRAGNFDAENKCWIGDKHDD